MNIPQIRLQTTSAKIEINTTPAQLLIEQIPGDLQIEQPMATMNITRVPGKLTIDQTKAREDVGYKSVRRAVEDAAQEGRKSVLEGIARRTSDGEELMKIENGGNPIATLAKRNSEKQPYQFNIGFIPSPNSVVTSYDSGSINVDIQPNKPTIKYTANRPVTEYQPGNVDILLRSHSSLSIDFENLKYVGTNYEILI
ncbi:DUF6470 family protein [Bacillus coreaensis]